MNVISIIGQKGGCGKTTVSVLLANVLAYKYGKKVIALDCDTNQQSLCKLRNRDLNDVKIFTKKDDEGNDIIGEDGKPVKMVLNKDLFYAYRKRQKETPTYDIIKSVEEADAIFKFLVQKNEEGVDYVLLDMPGNVDNPEYNRILSLCNIVFVPFVADDLTFDSNFNFVLNSCRKVLQSQSNRNLRKVYGFWNKYIGTERKGDFNYYNKRIVEDLPIMKMLDNKFGDCRAVRNRLFMNTLTAPIKWEDAGNSTALLEEMYNKIQELEKE